MIRTIVFGPSLILAALFATVPAYAICHLAPLKTYLDCPPEPEVQTEMLQLDLHGQAPKPPNELTTQPSQPTAETTPPQGARGSR